MIVASNLMAMLIQTLSAKLGIATGRNLPEVCRERFSTARRIGLWLQAEVIAMATDLAEFLGAALGFNLLLGIGLFPAAILTAIAAFGILWLQRFGFRPLEATIAVIIGVIGGCYVAELFMANPPLGPVVHGALVPQFAGQESLLLAVGILGATVMPHVIYLHSALAAGPDPPRERRAGEAALPLHADRRRDRDVDRRPDQHGDADHGGEHLPRPRADGRRRRSRPPTRR